ncbi:hypothetical protein [Chromobacterium sp. ATCC 53434]|uniref:hypothetical protein n=1 Tax=Chromobacterium sp. (strain ATCC 53434 / SC 14030) TaxID=2059672 RepID=UPI00130517AD|nr:hypothetical protein [Chromobacterium sp. ATCC 53434]
MAICVNVDAAGQLHSSATPIDQCTALVVLQANEYQQYQAAMAPLDYSELSAVWSMAFVSVLLLHFKAHGIGTVLAFIKRGGRY